MQLPLFLETPQKPEPPTPQPPTPVISLWNPWALLWSLGEKRFETRHWRFPAKFANQTILIHAAQKWSCDFAELCQREPFASAFLRHLDVLGLPDQPGMTYRRVEIGKHIVKIPFGGIIGQVKLLESISTANALDTLPPSQAQIEEAFGDYSTGRFAWVGAEHHLFASFIPCPGRQNFWQH